MGNGVKKVENNELETVVVQRRSLRATKPLKAGHIIAIGDLRPLRPCPHDAISPAKLKDVIGCKLRSDIEVGDYLKEQYLD